MATTLKTVI